jgi:hypothetical protein
MSGSTTGDHRAIETVAKALATAGAYDRFAYQEEVWQRAQALMENETVWGAVVELAGWLRDLWAEIDAPKTKRDIQPDNVRPASASDHSSGRSGSGNVG